jgi:hypothetical protein
MVNNTKLLGGWVSFHLIFPQRTTLITYESSFCSPMILKNSMNLIKFIFHNSFSNHLHAQNVKYIPQATHLHVCKNNNLVCLHM